MKKILLNSLLCAALAASLTFAQGRRGGGDPGNRLEHMTKQLNLTDAQKEQIKPILEEDAKKFQELRADASLDRSAKFEKFRALQEDSNAKISPILTEDQKKKWEEMKEKGRERMKERRQQ